MRVFEPRVLSDALSNSHGYRRGLRLPQCLGASGGAVTHGNNLELIEFLNYRTLSAGENGFTWAGSRFDRPESEPEPELRELRLLLQVFVGGWYIAIAHQGGNGPTRSAINQTPSRASP